jgi:L-aspartate oxidase
VDVVVVGSGLSGTLAALQLAQAGQQVLLCTQEALINSNTAWAQGGMAAYLPQRAAPEDSLEQHVADTLSAGAQQNNPAVVEALLAQAPQAIAVLEGYGVRFDTTPQGAYQLGKEGNHTCPRVLRLNGDQSGQGLLKPLHAALAQANIAVWEGMQLVQLLKNSQHQLVGALFLEHSETDELVWVQAPQVVLATGGFGYLYSHTTNPYGAHGHALVVAQQVGAVLKDLPLVQFHPTAFWGKGTEDDAEEQVQFLVSEALRGEGGVLKDAEGHAFAEAAHPLGNLAPRDVLSRAIAQAMQRTQAPCVYLHMEETPHAAQLPERFPFIYQQALRFGVDMCHQPLPVTPAAHYSMGGVATAPNGQTGVSGLWVLGEAACTGLHGANRLASNSLLEAAVMAIAGAQAVVQHKVVPLNSTPCWPSTPYREPKELDEEALAEAYHQLRQAVWEALGMLRSREGVSTLQAHLQQWQQHAAQQGWLEALHSEALVYASALALVATMAEQALALPHSVGAHTWAAEEGCSPPNAVS